MKKAAGDKNKAEKEPPKSKRYGDRTPAWAAWLRKTDPAEYERRFAEHPVDFTVK